MDLASGLKSQEELQAGQPRGRQVPLVERCGQSTALSCARAPREVWQWRRTRSQLGSVVHPNVSARKQKRVLQW